jgi:hypothetical protein
MSVADAPFGLQRAMTPASSRSAPDDPALHAGRLFLFSWIVGEQFLHATFVETGDVRPCPIQTPLDVVSFTQKLVPLGQKVLVFLAESVPIVFDPGAIRCEGRIASDGRRRNPLATPRPLRGL